jgi:ribonuclease BN (tRNA processing enzyme)
MTAAGLAPRSVDVLCITHLHLDHVADTFSLILHRWVSRADGKLVIIGPRGTRAFVTKLIDAATPVLDVSAALTEDRPPLRNTVQIVELDPTKGFSTFQSGPLKISAVENSHYEGEHHSGRGGSLALRVDYPERSIIFTGDTGPSDAVARLATDADLMVTEMIDVEQSMAAVAQQFRTLPAEAQAKLKARMTHCHLSPEEAGALAKKARVRALVLSHLAPGADGPVRTMDWLLRLRTEYDGPVAIARDLDRY